MSTATKTKPAPKVPAKAKAAPPPTPMPPPTSGMIKMDASMLKRVLAVVAPAASTDGGRPLLCSVLVVVHEDGTSDWVATDSYRLHHVALGRQGADTFSPGTAVLPAWWLQQWARTKVNGLATVTLSWTAEHEAFICCDPLTSLYAGERLNVEQYPKWRQLVDGAQQPGGEQLANFDPRLLAAVLAACDKWGRGGWRPVKLDLLKPCLFEAVSDDGKFTALLMPVRVG